ncbi:MAG: ABC-F family ATP-binding cassette domain-containing protein [Candidatus Promineifilaceae bacterium]|nr:ABC-F family ATP-binding cassette domain-containing protein [Candidatus Promineifilaceae bacterium]
MSVLTVSHVGHSFGAYDVFKGATASIPNDGKVGLVGPNGVGKTTLLLIIAGLTQPDAGSVHIARGTRLGYLSQESSDAFDGREHSVFDEMLLVFADLQEMGERLNQMETAMSNGRDSEDFLTQYSALQEQFELAGGYDFEVRIKQALSGLGFSPDSWRLPINHLSGGQKTRALLARLLLEQPDLLILDEPTNHLDVAAIEWLENALKAWSGAILVVSHDRYFLDSVVNTIWEMSPEGLETYRGNYSAYLGQRAERWERKQKEYDALMERIDKEMDFIRRNIAGQRTQMAQGKLSRLAREVEAIHAGGLEVLASLRSKGWLQVKNEVGLEMRPASTVGELHERIKALRPPVQPLALQMDLRASHRSGNIILRTNDLIVGYPGNPLFSAEDIELQRQDCAALIGPNGSGKTTFLRTILEEMPPLAGKITLGASLNIGYFAQVHDELNPDNTVLDEFLNHQAMPISEARNFLARFLFRGDEVFNKVSTLSGGELGRLALAILVLEKANFLLLDEPTNHLDIPAQETLQAALESYSGTTLLVSHDRYLVNRMADQIWELRDGQLRVYQGGYQEYLSARQREATEEKELSKANGSPVALSNSDIGKPALSKNALRQQAERVRYLEEQIHTAERRLEKMGQDMQAASMAKDAEEIRRISLAYADVETRLADLLEEWEAAHVD